jgi:hypothetical protein
MSTGSKVKELPMQDLQQLLVLCRQSRMLKRISQHAGTQASSADPGPNDGMPPCPHPIHVKTATCPPASAVDLEVHHVLQPLVVCGVEVDLSLHLTTSVTIVHHL